MKFHDILNTILYHRKKIFVNSFIGMVFLFLIFFFVYPVTYQSIVTVLPPEKGNPYSLGNLLQGMGGGDLTSLMSGSTSASSQLYVEVLKSRTAALMTISKLQLVDYFDSDSELEAAPKLIKEIQTEITKEGVIKLSVPVSTGLFGRFSNQNEEIKTLSASISNTLVESLDQINREKMSSKAKKARLYIDAEIQRTKVLLDSAEIELMEFQSKNKAVSLPEQIKVSIEAAAKLRGEITATEINYSLLSQNLKENSSLMENVKSRLTELRKQYEKFESSNSDFFLSFSSAPQLGLKLSNLFREVKVKNEVYILLQQQYYKEKIQENRDVPTVEVLDAAVIPLRASSPRLIVWTILGGIMIFFTLTFFIMLQENKLKRYSN
ncbi:MAG: GNVR domain-containing protein [Ignavibacteria bacterium]|nr:GNVR domain-containing protein [Ignavibacteria bacterium]MDP3831575.1 GNVR domain-containing protein [Ignavibacteriaceae bacterium]